MFYIKQFIYSSSFEQFFHPKRSFKTDAVFWTTHFAKVVELNELFSPKLSDFSPFDDNDRALLWRNDASIIRNLVWCEKNWHECQIIYAFSHALILVHHAQQTCIKGTVKKGGWVQSSYSSGFLGLTKYTQKEFCFCSICCYQKIMANFFIASDPGK